MKKLQTIIIGIFTILIIGAATANAATWTVTKSTNSNDNVCDADCSLREAVFKADSGDTVVFSPNLVGQTITLGGSEIVITRRITIDGYLNNPNVAFISGEMTSRIFHILVSGGLDLRNAILVQGNGKESVSDMSDGEGGAIYASGGLTMDRVSLRGNRSKFSGAITLLNATHHFTNCSITGNAAETNSAFSIRFGGTLYMANTTVSGNNYYIGDNNTFGGGAITIQASTFIVRNSTITNNSAGRFGGGVAIAAGSNDPILDIGNTIVAGNTAVQGGADIYSIPSFNITSRGGNLIGDLDTVPANTFNKPNDITGVNPLLGPLNFYGGFPVQSHSLQAGSPARNGGINANAVDPLTNQPLLTDTRGAGFPRIADGTVDIGAFEDQSGNTSLIVTKKTNSNDLVCDLDCSLREAVHQASLNFGTDTITFAPNVFGTLALGGSEIEIKNQNVNIVGYPTLNAETLIVSGGNANRIFYLVNATVNISGMTLANGNSGGFGGAIRTENNSNLTLDKVIVRNNFADRGGAIFIGPNGTGHITNSTINNNSANVVLAIEVTNGSTLNMANTTVSTNFDANGGPGPGAVFVVGTANIRNSTIAFNRVSGGTGGGIFSIGTLNIGNSIVANNIAATSPDIHRSSGVITSVGGNLVQNTNGFPAGTFSQTNDAVGVDPMLAALADNGGNVTTHSLMPNSPAINTGININAVDPFDNLALLFDARGTGFSRISGGTVDKGAFETLSPTAASVSISGRVMAGKQGLSRATVYLTDQKGETRTTRTNSFGYFRFEEVEVGETYIINVSSKRYQFNPQVVTLTEEINELNFTPQ